MKTIELKKKSVELEVCKAMFELCKRAGKEGKKVFEMIHYNSELKRLEATDGRAALTYEMQIDGLEENAFFSLSGNYLIQVENTSNWSFPVIQRVIPDLEKPLVRNYFDLSKISFSAKTISVEGELCGLLGSIGVRVSGIYTGLIKSCIEQFAFIALCEESVGEVNPGRPVLFHGAGINYVVMPINNTWAEARIPADDDTAKKTA